MSFFSASSPPSISLNPEALARTALRVMILTSDTPYLLSLNLHLLNPYASLRSRPYRKSSDLDKYPEILWIDDMTIEVAESKALLAVEDNIKNAILNALDILDTALLTTALATDTDLWTTALTTSITDLKALMVSWKMLLAMKMPQIASQSCLIDSSAEKRASNTLITPFFSKFWIKEKDCGFMTSLDASNPDSI